MLNFLSKHKYILVFSILFAVFSLALIINSGYESCSDGSCSYYFSEWQMHDALWHISLAKLAFNELPFSNPFHSGSTLSGYNYFIDLVLFVITKIGIDSIRGYFFVLPVIAVMLYLHSTWLYLRDVCKSNFERILSIFFLYFATSLSYLLTLYADQTLNGATLRGFPVVTSLYPASMLLNLPYAFSLPLIIYTIVYLSKNTVLSNAKKIGLIIFLAFGLKFYAGVTILLLLLGSTPAKKYLQLLLVIMLPILLAYSLFYRGSGVGFPFVFDPLALVHVVIDDVHLFYNHSLTLARYHLYENISGFPFKLVAIETLSIILFFAINWGTRALGYFLGFAAKRLDKLTKTLLIISLILGLIPVLFVQEGGWYNTMQFMYYSSLLLSLSTARLLSDLRLSHPKIAIYLSIMIILPLLPSTIEQFTYYTKPKNEISPTELKALETLRSQPKGVVHVNRPWAKRALIPVFAEKEMYYLDSDQLMLMLPSHTERLNIVKKYEGGSIHQVPVDYYFIYKNEVGSEDAHRVLSSNPGLAMIFDSDIISIFMTAKPGVTIK